jgi:hypothetical protein
MPRSNSLKDELRCQLGRYPVERLKKVDATRTSSRDRDFTGGREFLEPSIPRKAEIKASLRGIARALHNFMGTGSEERLPEKSRSRSD